MQHEIVDPRGRPLRRTPRVHLPTRQKAERVLCAPAGLGYSHRGGGAPTSPLTAWDRANARWAMSSELVDAQSVSGVLRAREWTNQGPSTPFRIDSYGTPGYTNGQRVIANAIGTRPALYRGGVSDATYLTVPAGNFGGIASVEVFAVAKMALDPPSDPNASGFWRWNASGYASHVPYTDGVIYDSFGTNTQRTVGNPTPSLASGFLYGVRASAAGWQARINGVDIGVGTVNGTLNLADLPGADLFRSWQFISGVPTYFAMNGYLGAFLLFPFILTSPQRADVESRLMAWFGI